MNPPKIMFIGTLTADVIARLDSKRPANLHGSTTLAGMVARVFASKTELSALEVTQGGSAANSAIAATRLGGRCRLVSCVGDDFFGDDLAAKLKRDGVDASGVKVIPGKTAVGIVLLSDGEKAVLAHKGVFREFGAGDLNEEWVKQSDVVVATALSSRENFGLFLKAVRLAHKHRKKIVFAPSITMLRARHADFKRHHENFDLFICNEEEALFYTGAKDAKTALKALPGKVKVITLAEKGAIAMDGEGGRVLRISAPKVKAVDATGCGDAFTGAFVHYYYSHGNLAEALRTATSVASLKLMHLGARFAGNAQKVEEFKRRHARELAVG